jgi:Predicted membrane protein
MAGGEARGKLRIDWPPAPAKAELHTDLRVDVADLTRLLPWLSRTWGAGTRAWLRRAVHGGAIDDGRVRIDGPLDDPTSSRAGGRWSADLPLRDGHLAFARDWPAATGLQGTLHFQDHRLELRGGSGDIAGIHATDLSGGVDDFTGPSCACTSPATATPRATTP